MDPAALKLRNGLPCITVDERKKQITIIVPPDYEVMAIATDSGQELTMAGVVIGRREFPGAVSIRPVRREGPPVIVPAAAAGEKG